jgi:tyrosinase
MEGHVMAHTPALRVRRSLLELQNQYTHGDTRPLEDVMRAWKGIKQLPPGDPRSFFNLGGYHGEPFRGAGWGFGNNAFWGGYCNHGNVLFPTWHRAYLVKLEEAMRSIDGCQDVTLPYWDETDSDSLSAGIPWALTAQTVELDGKTIPNPLRSFVFPTTITDNVSTDDSLYTKSKGYETVRFPFSGLVGTDAARTASARHNSQWTYDQGVRVLNQNIVNWLTLKTVNIPPDGTDPSGPRPAGVHQQFIDCLNAPNYTVFSNTTSMQQWNELNDGAAVVAIEAPHNSIHLAVGGYDVTGVPGQNGDASPIVGANGDMGENDTAALDPIFYFHHCNIDRLFWLWQKKWGKADTLEIIAGYPGTNSSDNQGSTPGIPPNTWLDLQTPLNPFTRTVDGRQRPYTSMDCVNIETQLGYTYSAGSLQAAAPPALAADRAAKVVHVSGINRAPIKGSFVVAAYATIDGKQYLLGLNAVLSRWAVAGCANCQTHLDVKSAFPLRHLSEASIARATFGVDILTKASNHPALASNADAAKKPARIVVR